MTVVCSILTIEPFSLCYLIVMSAPAKGEDNSVTLCFIQGYRFVAPERKIVCGNLKGDGDEKTNTIGSLRMHDLHNSALHGVWTL